MTISELIKELEVIKRAKGDIDVAVKYRDDGGEYLGQDEFINLHVFSEDGDKEYLLLWKLLKIAIVWRIRLGILLIFFYNKEEEEIF